MFTCNYYRYQRERISCICLLLVLSVGFLQAREPVWVFNNGPDAKLISIGQGQLYHEVGLTKLVSTGTDLTLTLPMDADDAFSAAERPFFAVRYKYKTEIKTAGLFFTTDTLTRLSDKSYSVFPVIGDNTWRAAIVDMRTFKHGNWNGSITSFRFDPTNPSNTDSSYQVSRLGFFASKAEAQRFIDAAVDKPDYSKSTEFAAPFQRVLVPGGSLFDGYNRTDFMLRATAIDNSSETTIVRFQGKGDTDKEVVIPLSDTNRRGFTWLIARKPGEYSLANCVLQLDDISDQTPEVQTAIRFVVARELLGEVEPRQFRPKAPVADATWNAALETLEGYGIDLKKTPKLATRAAAAVVLKKAIQTVLGSVAESPYTNAYLTRDRIRIGAWVNPRRDAIGEDFVKTYSSGGFDWIIAHGHLGGSEKQMLLRECDKYGVEVILNDGAYRNPVEATAEYFDHPCFAGTYITDEPGTEQYDKLADICNRYYKETNGKLPYINLLPMYANAAQLKYGASAAAIEYYDPDPELFKKYCDSFCQKFDPSYICTDIYPLNWKEGKRQTYKGYCESINVIADSARRHEKDFWCCIQTFAWTKGKRVPTEAEFRWQSYTMLSFGCKGLLCWTYAGYKPEFPSLITVDGKRTRSWYDAATVFKEVRNISDAFVLYKNIGAFTHGCTDDTPYLKFSNPLKSFPAIKEIQCDDPLLVGCFEEKDGKGSAFTLVNMSELEEVKTVQVKLRIKGSSVTAWPRGQLTKLSPNSDGFYHLTLASGEGVFVEVGE
ncbi:MAG: hypothetical protein PF904_10715 [Kiritimatiellae bacterium]|jgi:hypothetical protein|nr:hypothetical protein [Kiritimatiellia bacterium]